MRAYSRYLNHLKNEPLTCRYPLGGSTPPILFPIEDHREYLIKNADDPRLTDKIKKHLAKQANCNLNQITFTPASTQACLQVLAAITDPGDTILVEFPSYEPYLAAAEFLGLKVKRYQRSPYFEQDWQKIKKQAERAKVLLISNPHCPTGWQYDRRQLARLSELPLQVIVDEVFLPLFADGDISHVNLKKSNMISISSLSKSTGFSFIRFGWIIGSQDVTDRSFKVGLHFHSDFPRPILPFAYLAFKNWKLINKQLQSRAELNRQQLREFLSRKNHVISSHDFSRGFYGLLKVPGQFKSGYVFSQKLLKQDLLIRDAGFFEMPEWVRLHLLLPPLDFKKALAIIESYY
jgi:aspartate/methionine/tyrosine aminotransferase